LNIQSEIEPVGASKRLEEESALIESARAMIPVLKERALQAERDRCIPKETDAEFREAGFYRALQPARHGGLQLDYGAQTMFAREVGKACASSAWVGGILACHGWMAGMLPDEAQADIWGENPDVAVSTSFLPIGVKAERNGDKLQIAGRWRFSSGVDHCRWAIVLVIVPPENGEGPPDPVFALIDLNECLIEETWDSAGLAGTGSNDIVVAGAEIPPYRMMRVMELRGEETAGSEANDSYLYRLPLFAVFPFNII
tara:strand:+ start:14678 stop:15445 length:768 start_codon:yes stop_codon:yes gene_type:complete